MASKPGVVTRATGGATESGTTAGGGAPTGTAGKAAAKAKTEVERLRMLKVEVGFGLFVPGLNPPLTGSPITLCARHEAAPVFFFTSLICVTLLTRQGVLTLGSNPGFSPQTDFRSNSPAPWFVD